MTTIRAWILRGAALSASVCALSAAPPLNDNFTNRIQLVGNSNSFSGTLAEATIEQNEMYPQVGPGVLSNRSVWWSWTAAESLPVIVEVSPVPPYTSGQAALTVWQAVDIRNGYPTYTNSTQQAKLVASIALMSLVYPVSITFISTPGAIYEIQLIGMSTADFAFALIAITQPLIIQQPRSQTVSSNASVLLTVIADGIRPLSYQWRFNDADLHGESSPMLAQTNITTAQAGLYSVVVSNATGLATSEVAHVYVNIGEVPPILAAAQPATSNALVFTLFGEAGRHYRIQTSSNLFSWAEERIFPLLGAGSSYTTSVIFNTNGSSLISSLFNTNPRFVRASRYAAPSEICNLNLKMFRFAKQLWARDTNRDPVDFPSDVDLAVYYKGGISAYTVQRHTCPLGGQYNPDLVKRPPTCSIPGHVLEEPP